MKTEAYKKRLTEEKRRLESEMSTVGRKNPSVPGDWEAVPTETGTEADPVDQADLVMNRENNISILADLEARYDAILSALAKIEKHSYGTCEVCGKDIGEARLGADPAATTCVEHL
jgi:RNA polymerase-binding transcription factor